MHAPLRIGSTPADDEMRARSPRFDPVPNEIVYSRWDEASDLWLEETASCVCGREPGSNDCGRCPSDVRLGWTIDLALDSGDRPLLCYSIASVPMVPDPENPDRMIERPGWEWDTPATVMAVARNEEGGGFEEFRVASADGLPSAQGRNMGCALAARRNASVFDYLVGYAAPSVEDPSEIEGTFHYLSFDESGFSGDFTALSVPGGVRTDIAVDGEDQFWIVTTGRSGPPRIVGETAGHNFRDEHREIAVDPTGLSVSHGPRIAARADGEVAVVLTDGSMRPVYLFRRASEPLAVTRRLVAPLQVLGGYNRSIGEPAIGEEFDEGDAAFDYLLNNAALASVDDGSFGGIPMDIAFSDGDPQGRPIFAWVATRPGGRDYHAVIVARPAQRDLDRFFFETIDGPIFGSGAVALETAPTGGVRLAYHNGLDRIGNVVGRGSLQFYREEDEDEIDRYEPAHPTRGAGRCFAEDVPVFDNVSDVRAPDAGLDDRVLALLPRPAIDPDPCGRTTDPGLDMEIAHRGMQLLRAPGLLRPFSRFTQPATETDTAFVRRTNLQRILLFAYLRDLLVDLSAIDDAVPRSDGRSWNTVDEQADGFIDSGDELLGSDDKRAGTLDALFLGLDELADDLCGDRAHGEVACDGRPDIFRTRCPAPGELERNPHPFYRGLYFTEGLPGELVNGGASGADQALFEEYRDTFDATGLTDDALSLDLGTLETAGLLRDAFRGLIIRDGFVGRRGDHVCQPFEPCVGVAALPSSPPFLETETLQPAAVVLSADQEQSHGGCPAIRDGARLRYPGRCTATPLQRCSTALGRDCLDGSPCIEEPFLTRIGHTQFGCCDGYEARRCFPFGNDDCDPIAFDTRGICEAAGPLRCSFHPEIGCETVADCPGGVPDASPPFEECAPMRVCRAVDGAECTTDDDCRSGHCEPWRQCRPEEHEFVPCSDDAECSGRYRVRRCNAGNCEGTADVRDRDAAWTPLCRSEVCRGCGASAADDTRPTPNPPMYCDDGETSGIDVARYEPELCDLADTDTLCEGTGDRDGVTFIAHNSIRDVMHELRDAACAPGAACGARTEDIDAFPACLARPVLGHGFVRLLGDAFLRTVSSIAQSISNLGTSFGGSGRRITVDETIDEVRVHWVENADGEGADALRLPGYIELVLRFADPAVSLQYGAQEAIRTSPARIRIRLQPYFYASSFQGGIADACDRCNRRLPDPTLHLTIADVVVVRDEEGSEEPPDVSGCGCGANDCVNCLLTECGAAGTVGVDDIEEIPPEIASQVRDAVDRQLTGLDQLVYLITSDPAFGGLVLGRTRALDRLLDAPECGPRQAPRGPQSPCSTGNDVQERIGPADTIELLRIENGRAALLTRDNRPFLGDECRTVLDITNRAVTLDMRQLRNDGGTTCGGGDLRYRDARMRFTSDGVSTITLNITGALHFVEAGQPPPGTAPANECRDAMLGAVLLRCAGLREATNITFVAPPAGRYYVNVAALGEVGELRVETDVNTP